ncbi:MAG TPA: DUF5685 family protein [Acidimicrobiales bacterium]|jgi:hypothetical protein|nr:DUF5685 family protein [Acidimicrobiales bacterium]
MRGITRPCRHSLPPDLRDQWRSHLCGVCLTLRDETGQASRLLTGYDMLVPSVLIEAQIGRAETVTAGPCVLRGMRTAEVVPTDHPATRFAAGASLLNGGSALDDKIADGDIPAAASSLAARVATGARQGGLRLTAESGFPAAPFAGAARAATAIENVAHSLDDLLAPAGAAGAALLAHTAKVAGRPENEAALGRAGDAFGRLVHLLDAVDDFERDRAAGAFNPLAATGTDQAAAHALARQLVATIGGALDEVEMADPGLARQLLGPVLERSVARRFTAPAGVTPLRRRSRTATAGPVGATKPVRTRSATGAAAAAVVALPAMLPAIFGGGRRGWRRRPPYGDPYYGGGYGRRGPSCCDMLACDCCANLACDDCCGGGDDCCCCAC